MEAFFFRGGFGYCHFAISFEPYNMMEDLLLITRKQLALRNGQDHELIWCAYKGLVYDVTKSRMWRNGKHYEHWAGQDLTAELEDAPHNENVFDKFKVVGRLEN